MAAAIFGPLPKSSSPVITKAVSRYDSSAVSTLFLVEAMAAPPLAELIVGIRRDVQFCLVLTLGSGGVLVELVGDSQTLLLPCTLGDLIAALSKLKVARSLNGFWGRPKADLACLAHSLLALTAFVQARADRFVEIEINPLFLYPDDVLAVDVLLQVSAEP
jgi:succinyl-CoA synthetase beta subunit